MISLRGLPGLAFGGTLFLAALAASPASADQCGQLLGAINQLRSQIPNEPRDAANADTLALNNYIRTYNAICGGGWSGGGSNFSGGGGGAGGLNQAIGIGDLGIGLLGALQGLLQQFDQPDDAPEGETMEASTEPDEADTPNQAENGDAGAEDAPSESEADETTSDGGFKTDAQIEADCANSGNPGMCVLAAEDTRARSPAYQKFLAAHHAQRARELDAAQARLDKALADFERQKNRNRPSSDFAAVPKSALAGGAAANDDGAECGTHNGRRAHGQCFVPWDDSKEACEQKLGGVYYDKDEETTTPFCAYGAPANPMTAGTGPDEGAQCGDAGGHSHGGACWVMGITRDDCKNILHGQTRENAGYQYCAYDAGALEKEDAEAAAKRKAALDAAKKRDELRRRLKERLEAQSDDEDEDDDAPATGSTSGAGND